MTLLIASVLCALTISALCSLAEATLLSLTPSQVAHIATRQPRLGAIWHRFKSRIDRPIAAILVLNTAAHTVGATIAGAQFELLYGHSGLIWFSILFTFLMLQFTEILPKTLGVRHNQRLARLIALPLELMVRGMSPILRLIQVANRPFARTGGEQEPTHLQEIAALAGLARISKLISSQQERIIKGTSQLSEKKVGDIMIPIEQVSMLSTSQSLSDAIIAAHLDPHTRFPICEQGDRNRVLGYVNFKELVYHARTNPNESTLRGIIRPVHFVDPDRSGVELLRLFVERHEHMAIVQDAGGRTLGLATLEDVIEELVGELEDEFDRLPRMFHPLAGGTWMVGGGVLVQDLARELGVELPDATGTISGWMIRRMGHVPRTSEALCEAGLELTVRRTRRGMVFEVIARRAPSAAA